MLKFTLLLVGISFSMQLFAFIADQRITSTGAVYAFDSYLKTEFAGTYNSSSQLEVHHKSSH